MANGIFVPPWLQGISPAELGRLHATGIELGQQAAAQQTRQLMAMQELRQREAEAAARQAQAQQEIELEIQKQQAQAQQAQQELALRQQTERREAAASAMRYAGQQKFQNVFSQLTAQGVPQDQATLEAMKQSAPFMFAQAPGEAMRTVTGLLPKPPVQEFTTPSGQKYIQDQRGGVHLVPPPRAEPVARLSQVQSKELDDLYRSKREIQKDLQEEQSTLSVLKPGSPEHTSTKAQVDMLQKQIGTIESRIKAFGGETPKTASTGERKRIKVISPQGKRGTIWEDQLEEALKEGYKEI